VSVLPSFINDNVQYDDPNTLEESIRRAKFIYDQHNGRPTLQKILGIQDGIEEEED